MKVQKSTNPLDLYLERLYDLDQVADSAIKTLTATEQSAVDLFKDTYEVYHLGGSW